jgi:hypothetical protein
VTHGKENEERQEREHETARDRVADRDRQVLSPLWSGRTKERVGSLPWWRGQGEAAGKVGTGGQVLTHLRGLVIGPNLTGVAATVG